MPAVHLCLVTNKNILRGCNEDERLQPGRAQLHNLIKSTLEAVLRRYHMKPIAALHLGLGPACCQVRQLSGWEQVWAGAVEK